MNNDAEKIVDHYLANNAVACSLNKSDRALLRQLLYNFVAAKRDLLDTSMLLAYCSKTLTDQKSFSRELAKVTRKAMEIILRDI